MRLGLMPLSVNNGWVVPRWNCGQKNSGPSFLIDFQHSIQYTVFSRTIMEKERSNTSEDSCGCLCTISQCLAVGALVLVLLFQCCPPVSCQLFKPLKEKSREGCTSFPAPPFCKFSLYNTYTSQNDSNPPQHMNWQNPWVQVEFYTCL